jgi:glycosyltransferase involved in cell wall biosynthesis
MKLLFFTEARFQQTKEGKFYYRDLSFSYQLFKRYLNVFECVMIVARSTAAKFDAINQKTQVDKDRVTVLPLPYYVGPYQYFFKRKGLLKTLRKYIDSNPNAATICRVPGTIGTAAAKYMFKKNRPYGVEVVGDPYDVFTKGSFNHPLRVIFQKVGVRYLKDTVKSATASIYVTNKSLQMRYPAGENRYNTHASDVIMPPEAFVKDGKKMKNKPPYSIVTIGTLSSLYKSPDIAIETMAILKKSRLKVKLKWIGTGKYMCTMKDYAKKTNVEDYIDFVGNISTAAEVRNFLDSADLFVLPSRQEGLPRALAEAMARGLPCIGTEIGGIPEMLDKVALVKTNNPKMLANKIAFFLTTPKMATEQARRNLKEAHNYASEILDVRRKEFYQYVKNVSHII